MSARWPARARRSLRLAVLATCAVLAGCGAEETRAPASDSMTASEITRVALAIPPGQNGTANAVVSWRGGFVIVGEAGDRAAVWRSRDAAAWVPAAPAAVAHDERAEREVMSDVEGDGSRLVAGGYVMRDGAPVAAVWASATEDPRWELQIVDDSSPSSVHGVAVVRGMTLAVGERGRHADADAVVWLSGDARTWRSIDAEAFRGSGRQAIAAVTTTDRGFVAVGTDARAPAIWESADGVAWERVTALPTDVASGSEELEAVAARGSVVVAVGNTQDRTTAWRSVRPGAWTRLSLPDSVSIDRHMNGLTAAAGFLAAGFENRPQGNPDAAILRSETGASWAPVAAQSALGGQATQLVSDLAATNEMIALAGADYRDGPRPVVWLAPSS